MKRQRIEKAVEVIQYAIKNQVSVKEASVKCGLSDTYVKNVKADVKKGYKRGYISESLYNLFFEPYLEYCSSFIGTKSSTQSPTEKVSEPNKPRDIPRSGGRESFRDNGNNAEYEWVGGSNYGSDHVRTLDQLMAAAEVDLDVWKVKDHLINKWDVTS